MTAGDAAHHPGGSHGRRGRREVVAALSVLAAALVALVAALLAPAVMPPPAAAAVEWPAADWKHANVVVNFLQQRDGATKPVVYLLGGSVARESTITDRSWRRQIRDLGGPSVLAFNLGATNQSFKDNIEMVKLLPDRPTLVLIGVNLTRYCSGAKLRWSYHRIASSLTLDQADAYPQHRFDSRHILPDDRKRALIGKWYTVRYPPFKQNFAYNQARLRELVALCQQRGFGPVLFKLPIDKSIVGDRLNGPLSKVRRDSLAVSADYGIPYVDFLSECRLVNRDFADLWHLVESGRVKWQRRLASMTVYRLKQYGIPAPPPPAAATPSPTPSSSATDTAPAASSSTS